MNIIILYLYKLKKLAINRNAKLEINIIYIIKYNFLNIYNN